MFDDNTKFVAYNDLRWSGVLKAIPKSPNILQPLFEAFTNSLESIRLRQQNGDKFESYIKIIMDYNSTLDGKGVDLSSLTIIDNGIGFDKENYKRLITFKDDTKGFNNRGSGRLQMIHSFQTAKYNSVYKENGNIMQREFILSKIHPFLSRNTIVYNVTGPSITDGEKQIETILTMSQPLLPKDAKEFAKLGSDDIKKALLNHYMLALCNIKDNLPHIEISYCVAGEIVDCDLIEKDDIPDPTQKDIVVSVPLCRISEDMK